MKVSFEINTAEDAQTAIGWLGRLAGVDASEHAADIEAETARMATLDTPATDTPPEENPMIGVELDVNGTPWLDTVHAGTKSKTKDGVWKRKRGVSDAALEEAERSARAKIAATPEPTLPESAAPAPNEEPVVAEAAPASPTATEPVEEISLDQLAEVYSACVEKGLISPDQVLPMYQRHGCTQINDIATNAVARAGVYAEMKAHLDAANAPAPAAPGLPGMGG